MQTKVKAIILSVSCPLAKINKTIVSAKIIVGNNLCEGILGTLI